MNKTNAYVTVGKIGRSYGVYGWLRVHPFTEFGGDLLTYSPCYVSRDATTWEAITAEEGRIQTNVLVVKIKGIETPEEAKLLAGKLIALKRSQLPKLNPNEYYWSDLVGLTVIDQHHHVL